MRSVLRAVGLASFLVAAVLTPLASRAQQPLTVCMAENNPPLSWKSKNNSGGFDVLLAQALADELKRPLQILWFEPELDKESSLTLEVNALLSAGLCDLVSSYMLYAPALGAPIAGKARPPDHEGAKRKREREFVRLGNLIASDAYLASPLAIVLGPNAKDKTIDSLDALRGLRIGTIASSLGGVLLAGYKNGVLRSQVQSLGLNDDVFAELEKGSFDVAFAPLNKFDAYRNNHPNTALAASGYLHPFRFNLGFVAREEQRELINALNRFLAAAGGQNRLERLAQEAKLTYVAPAAPLVQPVLTTRTLMQSD
jgi:ABC-type amino acid transport substrate-binding protein